MFRKNFSNFAQLTRLYSIPVSIASCAVIYAYAHYSMNFSFLNFFLIVISICLLQMGANLFDDFIDVSKELKKGVALEDIKFYSYIPKAALILNKTYSFSQIKVILSILFLIPVLVGIYFVKFSGFEILYFMIIGGILTLFYPISSKYYLSEIIIGLIYGPLIIMGGFFALTKEFDLNLLYLSFAIFTSTLVLLHAHNIMDWEFDKDNKKTLALLASTKEKAIDILKGLIGLSYAIIIIGVLTLKLNPHTLYVFLTLPLATKLINSMKDYINIKDVKLIPKWYYGIFENWKEIKNQNIEFFMYRFYLGRNFTLLFAIFASLGAIV